MLTTEIVEHTIEHGYDEHGERHTIRYDSNANLDGFQCVQMLLLPGLALSLASPRVFLLYWW